jgi:ubiquinone/menaquinone biosynthesis C-methylase UbiE
LNWFPRARFGGKLGSMKTEALLSYSLIRSAFFTAEGLLLPAIDFLVNRRRPKLLTDDLELLKASRLELLKLLKTDAQNIANGLYPISVLKPESAFRHLKRIPRLFIDGVRAAHRKSKKEAHHFDQSAAELLESLPEYYRRNFHFQESGYLTDKSAELYDHQVEVLFAGSADAMRRLILKPLKQKFSGNGKGLRILEIGAGTGRATEFAQMAFPQAHITALDLSEAYLRLARKKTRTLKKTDFIQGDGADLPFKDQQFDAVYSVFLFHELPLEIREKVISESLRVLKPGGFVGLVDSLQIGDNPTFDRALTDFPKEFHEPFYKNYITHPMEELFSQLGVSDTRSETGFFSKVVWGSRL